MGDVVDLSERQPPGRRCGCGALLGRRRGPRDSRWIALVPIVALPGSCEPCSGCDRLRRQCPVQAPRSEGSFRRCRWSSVDQQVASLRVDNVSDRGIHLPLDPRPVVSRRDVVHKRRDHELAPRVPGADRVAGRRGDHRGWRREREQQRSRASFCQGCRTSCRERGAGFSRSPAQRHNALGCSCQDARHVDPALLSRSGA